MNYKSNGIKTEKVTKEIDKFKAKMTTSNLTDHINGKFKTNFKADQIRYQVNKLLERSYGKPEEDAYKFVSLAKDEVAKQGGSFCIDIDDENRLKKCLFVSSRMLEYSKSFLDLVIIDATYKKNRFSLPLVNVIGIIFYI